jgi:hypothetical protein
MPDQYDAIKHQTNSVGPTSDQRHKRRRRKKVKVKGHVRTVPTNRPPRLPGEIGNMGLKRQQPPPARTLSLDDLRAAMGGR